MKLRIVTSRSRAFTQYGRARLQRRFTRVFQRWIHRRGASIQGVARAAGVGNGTVRGIRDGDGNPTLDTLLRMSHVLRVPLCLMFLETEKPRQKALIKAIRAHR